MDDLASLLDPCDPVEAYIRPIRSVLFIDDQFPTFADTDELRFGEAERARALWQACTQQGWVCDIDNSPEWASAERQKRLAACDLLVLDYHLVGENSVPTLSIIRDLARSGTPNLVVVYTKDPNPDSVLLAVASWARGVMCNVPLTEVLEDLEESIEWSSQDLIAFFSSKTDWRAFLDSACERAGLNHLEDSECITLLERKLRRDFGVEPSEEIRQIDRIGYGDYRWLQCGNLFLVIVSKPSEQDASTEAATFLGGLEGAVRQWAPPWLACLVAASRQRVELGAFRDDLLLPDETLQKGLLGYISDPTSDLAERSRRATEIATYILSQRSVDAASALGENLLVKATSSSREQLTKNDFLQLNAYLCSDRFTHYHLRVGTIFVQRGASPVYWVCVTPACDMVPRMPDEKINPWAAELYPLRPVGAIRLKILADQPDLKKALKNAHLARHLFFWDRTVNSEQPLIASCFQDTADPNPRLEQLIAADRALMQGDGFVELYRCVRQKEGPNKETPMLELIRCEPVAQLRAPYAERVVHVVGGHVSRIGVDFVPLKTSS